MSEKPLISIILPVYNTEQYMQACFDSLKAQVYPNLEIVFVDDGSTDGSGAMIDRFAEEDARVVSLHKANGGVSEARNFGIEHSTGEYICFVDSDDTVDPDYVSYLYDLLVRFDVDLSVCQHRVCYQNGQVNDLQKEEVEQIQTSEQWLERFLYNDVNDTSPYCKLIKKELIGDIRFPVGKIFEDLATMYKLILKAGRVAVGYQSKLNYIFHDISISNNSFRPQYYDYAAITDEVTEGIVEVYPDLLEAALAKRYRSRFSVLNLMINSDEDKNNLEKRDALISYLKKHKQSLLSNPKVGKYEKTAARLLSVSYPAYRMVWKRHRKKIME